MTRLNSRQREIYWPIVAKHVKFDTQTGITMNYGPFCRGCGCRVYYSKLDGRQGELDCILNDGDHSSPDKLQMLCHGCNKIKNPSKVYKPEPTKTQSELTNLRCEDAWRGWIMQKVLDNGGYPVSQAIASGAELFKLSPETIERRYLPKITSEAGKFIIVDGNLVLKGREEKRREELRKEIIVESSGSAGP